MSRSFAPSADLAINGNPDIVRCGCRQELYANGNVGWRHDRTLDPLSNMVDFPIAGYVEDIR